MGLDTGTVSDSDEYYCGGYKMIDGFKIQCHTREGDGWLTTGEAVEYSCNVALMEMVEKIGKENFTKFQNVYNFGLKTGIDLYTVMRDELIAAASDAFDSKKKFSKDKLESKLKDAARKIANAAGYQLVRAEL